MLLLLRLQITITLALSRCFSLRHVTMHPWYGSALLCLLLSHSRACDIFFPFHRLLFLCLRLLLLLWLLFFYRLFFDSVRLSFIILVSWDHSAHGGWRKRCRWNWCFQIIFTCKYCCHRWLLLCSQQQVISTDWYAWSSASDRVADTSCYTNRRIAGC